jgi:hypothetical protein
MIPFGVRAVFVCGLSAICVPALAENKPPPKPAPAPVQARPAPAPPRPAPVVQQRPAPVVQQRPTATAQPRPAPVVQQRPTATAQPRPTATAQPRPTALQQLKYANQGTAERNHVFDGTKAPTGSVSANPGPKPSMVGVPTSQFKPQVRVTASKPPPAPPRNLNPTGDPAVQKGIDNYKRPGT